jgi:hypothetical protein
MHYRCKNPNYPWFRDYGGRGIKVCERWNSFENFLADMGIKPAGLTLEREHNDRDYEPGNCHWATWDEQGSNKRNTRFVEFRGETISLPDFSRNVGVARKRVTERLRRGWTTEEIAIAGNAKYRPASV